MYLGKNKIESSSTAQLISTNVPIISPMNVLLNDNKNLNLRA